MKKSRSDLPIEQVRVPVTRGLAPPNVRAQLDRYNIAMILQAVYEWGGYRYSNASDAIAAAERADR
jgi:hypothetical protein